MRALLHSANLGPQYLSWALIHAVYLKNRLPHWSINKTPYEAYTGQKPDIKRVRVSGSPVVCRMPGRRHAKLDIHSAMGIFLGYTATDSNIYCQDNGTKRIKLTTHVTFDEAGYTNPPNSRSPTQQLLQHLQGSPTPPTTPAPGDIIKHPLQPVSKPDTASPTGQDTRKQDKNALLVQRLRHKAYYQCRQHRTQMVWMSTALPMRSYLLVVQLCYHWTLRLHLLLVHTVNCFPTVDS